MKSSYRKTGWEWTVREEQEMLAQIHSGMAIKEIAKCHRRSVGAIESRQYSIKNRLLKTNGVTQEGISKLMGLPTRSVCPPAHVNESIEDVYIPTMMDLEIMLKKLLMAKS